MFLFGGGGGGGGATSSDPAVLQRLLAEKDEEIEDLNAKVTALREALQKDEMDDFEKAIAEKNKVLEEAFSQIEELKAANTQMAQQLAAGAAPAVQLPVPPVSQPTPVAEASPAEGGEGAAASISAEAPAIDPAVHSQLQMQLAGEQQARLQAEDIARQASQAANELQAQLMATQEQVAQLQEGDSARMQAENQDLRSRLANTIAKAIEAQQALAAQRGEPPEVAQSFSLLLDEGVSNLGTIFATRDLRQLGHGWPVHRVREGSWAESQGLREGDELHGMNGYPVEVLPEMEVVELLQTRPLQLDWVRRQQPAEQAAAEAGSGPPEATGPPQAPQPAGEEDQVRLAREEAEKARAEAAQAAAAAQQYLQALEKAQAEGTTLQETLSNTEALLQASREEGERLKQQLEVPTVPTGSESPVQQEAVTSARALEEAQEQLKCLKEAVQVAADQEEAVRQEARKLQLEHEEEVKKLRLEVEALQTEREALQRQPPRMPSGVGDDETDGWEGDVSDRNEAETSSTRPQSTAPSPVAEVSTPATTDNTSRIAELETQLVQKERETEEALAENRDLESHLASLRAEVAAAEGELGRAGELQEKLTLQEERAQTNQQLLEESQARVAELEKQLSEQADPTEAVGVPSGASGTVDGWEPEHELLQAPAPSPVEPRSPRLEPSPHHQRSLTVPEVTAVAAQQMEAVSTQLPAMLRSLEEELRQAREENAALRAAQETTTPVARRTTAVSLDDLADSGWDLDAGIAVPDVPQLSAEELVEQLKDELQQAVDELSTAKADGKQLRESLGVAEAEVTRLLSQQQTTVEAALPAAATPPAATGGWGDLELEAPQLAAEQQAGRPAVEAVSSPAAAPSAAVTTDGPADGGWDLGEDLIGVSVGGGSEKTRDDLPNSELREVRGQLEKAQAALQQTEDRAGQASEAAKEAAARSAQELEELRKELDQTQAALKLAREEAGEGLKAAEEQLASAREEAEAQQAQATEELTKALQQAQTRAQTLEESLQLTQLELSQLQASQAKSPPEPSGSPSADDGWGLDLLDTSPPELEPPPAGGQQQAELEAARQELADARTALSATELQLGSLRTEAQQQQAAAATALEEATARSKELQEALNLSQEEVKKLSEVPVPTPSEQAGPSSGDGWDLDDLEGPAAPVTSQEDLRIAAEQAAKDLEATQKELSDARAALSTSEQQVSSLREEASRHQAAAQEDARQAAAALDEIKSQAAELQEALHLSQEEVRKLTDVPAVAPTSAPQPVASPGPSADGWDLEELDAPAASPAEDTQSAKDLELAQKELADTRATLSSAEAQLGSLREELQAQQVAARQEAAEAGAALKQAQEELAQLKAAQPATPPAQETDLLGGDGWDLDGFDSPAPKATETVEEVRTKATQDLQAVQEELAEARANLGASEQQLSLLREEAQQQKAAAELSATDLKEATNKAKELQVALQEAQQEVEQLKASKVPAPQPQAQSETGGLDLDSADGWDLNLGVEETTASPSKAADDLEETRRELASLQEAKKKLEEQLSSLQTENKDLKAAQEASRQAAEPTPAQPATSAGPDDDGWDFDIADVAPTSATTTKADDGSEALEAVKKELAEAEVALKLEQERLTNSEKLQQDLQKELAVSQSAVKDSEQQLLTCREELAVSQSAAKDSEQQLLACRKELAVTESAAKDSEQQLLAIREEIAQLKAAAAAVQSSAVPSPTAPAAGGAEADDGWGDFDLDTMAQAPASPTKTEAPATPAVAAPAAPASTGGDDDGWDFDLPTEPPEARPAPVASTGETAAEDGQQALEEARKELADAQAALKLAEDRAEAAEGLRKQLAEAEASARQLREESSQQKVKGEEASEKVEQLEEALMLAARELKSAREEVAQLKVAAAAPPASGAGALPADDGWDFDLEGEAAPAPSPAPAPAAPAADAATLADLSAVKEELEQAQGKIRGLEDALQQAQDKLASSAVAPKASAPTASLGDDGWDFDAADLEGTPSPSPAAAAPTPTQAAAAAPPAKKAGDGGWGDDGWDFFDDSSKPAASASPGQGLDQEAAQKSLEEKQAALEQAQKQAQESQAALERAQSETKERQAALDQQAAALEKSQKEGQQRSLELQKTQQEAAAAQEALEAVNAEKAALKAALQEAEEKLAKAEAAPGVATTATPAAAADDDGWDFDLDDSADKAAAPAAAPDPSSGEVVRLQDELKSREAELERAKQELADSQSAAQGSEQQLLACREEIAQLKAASAAAKSSTAAPLTEQSAVGAANDGWDDFALDMDVAAPVPAAAQPSKVDDDLGWDLDLGTDAAPPPAVSPALQEESLRQAEEAASKARADEQKAIEAREAAEQETKLLQAALKSTEDKLKASEAERANGQELQAALAKAREQLEAAQAEAAKLKAENKELLSSPAAVPGAAPAADDDGWDFDLSQGEVATAPTVTAAVAQPPAQTASKEATGGDDDGWDFDFDGDDKAAEKPSCSPEDVGHGRHEEVKALITQLDVANGRVKHLEDELQAERVVNGTGTAAQLRTEVTSLSEALARERQEREREEAHLGQLVRRAQEDLRQQAAAARASAGAQADSAQLLEQLESLRQQRDQARSIAQCIARQTSTLAEELYRLRTSGDSSAQHPAPAAQPLGSVRDPERTLLRAADSVPVEEDQPEAAVAPEALAGPASSSSRAGSSRTRAAGYSDSTPQTSHAAAPNEDGDDLQPPRPSVEVTSGWDVFDPDDQFEHTIPTSLGCSEGWDTNMDDLLDGRTPGAGSAAVGPAPELSPASPADAGLGTRTQASPSAGSPDLDLELLLGEDLT